MTLLKKDLYRYFPLWLCSLPLLIFLLLLNRQPEALIAKIESIYICLPMLVCCLLFSNNDENDLVISSGKPTCVCVLTRGLTIYLISLFAVLLTLINDSALFLIFSIKLIYCFVSYALVSFLLLSVSLFLRLIARNAYSSVCAIVFLIAVLDTEHTCYIKGYISPVYGYFDPFLSAGILAMKPICFFNWIIITLIALAFIFFCTLLLRKDKLYSIT